MSPPEIGTIVGTFSEFYTTLLAFLSPSSVQHRQTPSNTACMSAGGDNGAGVTQYNVTQYNAILQISRSPRPSPGREAAPVSPCAAATRGSHFYSEPSPASGSRWPTHSCVNVVLFRYIMIKWITNKI